MTEIRCVKCRRLLFKIEPMYRLAKSLCKIETKCPKCKYESTYFYRANYFEDEFLGAIEIDYKSKKHELFLKEIHNQ